MRGHTNSIKESSSKLRASKTSAVCRSRKTTYKPQLEFLENRLAPAIITVTTSADDLTPNDGSVSLREAITAMNAGNDLGDPDITAQNPGTFGAGDSIRFNIPGLGVQTIMLTSALPAITAAVGVDGSTQPGYSSTPLIEIDGASAGVGVNGLEIRGGNSALIALAINRFTANGILLDTNGQDAIDHCFIGTNAAGTRALSNFGNGIFINGISGYSVSGSIISGNGGAGILIQGAGGMNNTISGNMIGTNAAGTTTIGNNLDGVRIEDSTGIGIDHSVISGNGSNGISIVGTGATGNFVDQANFIGTNANGTEALGNGGNGVFVNGPSGTMIGAPSGVSPPLFSVISGNGQNGILIQGPDSTGTYILENLIGTNLEDSTSIGNALDGIRFDNAGSNVVGDNTSSERFVSPYNIISGNKRNGIHLLGPGASNNIILGNIIGSDPTQMFAVGNQGDGVLIDHAPGNQVNGNSIGGNVNDGILIRGPGATGNTIKGNYIGIDPYATVPNLGDGIHIDGASNNMIGGSFGVGNHISGNDGNGIHISGTGATGNIMIGNGIGIGSNPDAMNGNKLNGVAIEGIGNQNNQVGGPDNNLIEFNRLAGVAIFASPPGTAQNSGNAILGNSIFGNGGLGIDLVVNSAYPTGDGVTPDSPGGPHSGPNDLQNFPVLTFVKPIPGGLTTVRGTLNSIPNTTFSIEIFASSQPDPTGYGEGEVFLGTTTATTDSQGNGNFMVNVTTLANAKFLCAVALDPQNNTSEFSHFLHVGTPGLVGRASQTGQWWVAASTGSSFTSHFWTTWSLSVNWADVVTGDFNGDGTTDIAARDPQTGNWWVSISDGISTKTSVWTTWSTSASWVDVKVGDFNGDGRDDIIGRYQQGGQWWLATSTGSSFINRLWATWSTAATWVNVLAGDFNGDGKTDLTGRWLQGGQWWTSLSTGSSSVTSLWATWSTAANWIAAEVGDFNGDGKADIVGLSQGGQVWMGGPADATWVGLSTGSSFSTSFWGPWGANFTSDFMVADFNGDGKSDLIGRWPQGQGWFLAISTGSSFTQTGVSNNTWSPAFTWVDVQAFDFNLDGKSDITGRALETGEWRTSLFNGSFFNDSKWATWSTAVTWADVHTGYFT